MSKSWKKQALELMVSTDLSWRQIAKRVGKSKSTVSDYLRKFKKDPKFMQEVMTPESKPKILLFDIETSLIKAYVWSLWKQNISINQVIDDWFVICWSAKWFGGEGEVFNSSVHHYDLPLSGEYKDNERFVVEALWKCLDDADIVVAYNGKSFDRKKMNFKFFEYGLPEPSPYKVVDPMLIVKGNFAITSRKMDYVAKYVQSLESGKHETNINLWIACMENDVQSLDYMQSYCDQDIIVLEEVYKAVRHWDKNSPQMSMYYDDDKMRCNSCGSEHLTKLENKAAYTSLSKFDIYRCDDCSKIMRGRENQVPKEERKKFVMNVR